MNGQKDWNADSEWTSEDVEQLVMRGHQLHDQAILVALRGLLKKIWWAGEKVPDCAPGAYQNQQPAMSKE